MKTTRDFDLSFRPETYWEHGDPFGAILSGIKGQARRLMVKEALEAGKDVSEWLLDPLLEEEPRRFIGGIHPFFMGGEYLPSDLPGETTIARMRCPPKTGPVNMALLAEHEEVRCDGAGSRRQRSSGS